MTDKTNFETFEMQDAVVVTARGYLTLREMNKLRDPILGPKGTVPLPTGDCPLSPRRVILSLADIDGMDMFAAGALIGLHKVLGQLGGEIKLAGVQPHLLRTLRISGLTQIFEMYRTVDDAVGSFDDEMDAPMECAQ